nr:transposase [Bacteroidetes bacterium endosymbiont of Geopemphigus sp.]
MSRITNSLAIEVMTCQNRPLESKYLIVCFDGIVFKVHEGSKMINKTIYLSVYLWLLIFHKILCKPY